MHAGLNRARLLPGFGHRRGVAEDEAIDRGFDLVGPTGSIDGREEDRRWAVEREIEPERVKPRFAGHEDVATRIDELDVRGAGGDGERLDAEDRKPAKRGERRARSRGGAKRAPAAEWAG